MSDDEAAKPARPPRRGLKPKTIDHLWGTIKLLIGCAMVALAYFVGVQSGGCPPAPAEAAEAAEARPIPAPASVPAAEALGGSYYPIPDAR